MSRRTWLLPTMGVLILLVGCSCEDEKAGWNSRSIGGLQSETLTIGDHTRVTVTESVTFAEGSALLLSGQVEFLMAANTFLELPADFSVPANAGVTFKPGDSTPWQKLRVSQPQVNLRNLTIQGAIIGLDLSGSGSATLSSLTIKDCEQYGLYAVSLDSLILENSSISGCVSDGAHIKFSKARLSHVRVSGCGFHGVYLLSGQSVLVDCTMEGNGIGENGSGVTVDGTESAYSITHCLFDGNYYGLRDTANRDVIVTATEFRNSVYFPLLFAHPFAERVFLEQNNILPGPGGRRVELATTGSFRVDRYLPAMRNWWGSSDLAEITAPTSLIGDGRYTANSDTIRVEPILLEPVTGAGPRR